MEARGVDRLLRRLPARHPACHSSLKTLHRRVFFTRRPSRVRPAAPGLVGVAFFYLLPATPCVYMQKTQSTDRFLGHFNSKKEQPDLTAELFFSGGGEGSRTPVRKSLIPAFSECSRFVWDSPHAPPKGRLRATVVSSA